MPVCEPGAVIAHLASILADAAPESDGTDNAVRIVVAILVIVLVLAVVGAIRRRRRSS